ncbi:MAG: acetylglutamate kinase [Dysgonamonadaceae bacterium]|jgi:acetylglutamate kinase|nr:acetylglutamate kinase [Dysgonamonadaceae bacterium]
MNQLTIVKVGGKIVESPTLLPAFIKDFARISGYKILVHGGGSAASKIAGQLGVQSQMVDGRRITDEESLKVVTMVYAGLVNKNIVAQLQALYLDAVGLTGADMNLICAVKRPVDGVDYGLVGDICEVNTPVLKYLLEQNYLPVLVPVTHDGKGQLLNTNADAIAAETAKALAYNFNVRLIYCFEKKGVLLDENDDSSVIPNLNKEQFLQLKEEGVIHAGMIPKLENAFGAIAAGVKEVIITRASDIHLGGGTFLIEN